MKKRFSILILFLIPLFHQAQDTFSIVAVDSSTGEVGSAGATCLDNNNITNGARVISEVLTGKGAIHTQAQLNFTNKANAKTRMLAGDSPDEIIAWLIANDSQNDPTIRQYGIVDFDSTGSPRVAAFTGVDCMNYKSHIIGPNYAIQGNILLGQQILDSMEARFLNTNGTLADKLMAAMQGANVPGADSRCLNEGVSSRSAFLRISRPNDPPTFNYIDLIVGETPFGAEPIDSLQSLFDNWASPVCDITIPADAIVADSSQSLNESDKSIWICSGDTVTLTGSRNTVYLEPEAVLIGDSGNNNEVYVKDSSAIIGGNLLITDVYFEVGSNIDNPGLAPFYFSCDSIRYDYSIAPQNGCLDNSTKLDQRFEYLGWNIFPNPSQGELMINTLNPVTQSATVKLYDLAGKKVFEMELGKGESRFQISLPEKLKGLFLLELNIDGRVGVEKWVIE